MNSSSPLEQFEILILLLPTLLFYKIFPVPFSVSSLYMLVGCALVLSLLTAPLIYGKFISTAWQSIGEILYKFVFQLLEENSGKSGYKYFPWMFTLFVFILSSNLIGLIPYSFTTTSHIVLTFFIAFSMFSGMMIVSIKTHKLTFFSLFFPGGTPAFLSPLIVGIELISYISRPISLSIRLCANMIAGHILLKIIASFVWVSFVTLTKTLPLLIIAAVLFLPLGLFFGLVGLELAIGCLQSYVFVLLLCIYLNESMHLH